MPSKSRNFLAFEPVRLHFSCANLWKKNKFIARFIFSKTIDTSYNYRILLLPTDLGRGEKRVSDFEFILLFSVSNASALRSGRSVRARVKFNLSEETSPKLFISCLYTVLSCLLNSSIARLFSNHVLYLILLFTKK
jgi:hypothetical protein